MSTPIEEKILILVKAYPTFSKKHFELVCTAGINEQGKWRRLYPIPFRDLNEWEKYKKYQWVQVYIEKSDSDPRPESYRLSSGLDIELLGDPLPTQNNWQVRKDILSNIPVYRNLEEIIQKAKDNKISLCQFKPKEIFKLDIEETERKWPKSILTQIESERRQGILFEDMKRKIRLVKKLPYKFSYEFADNKDKRANLMIVDWEIGQLYWNCLQEHNNDEQMACEKVKEKYQNFIKNNEVTLFLGTTHKFHSWSSNPFIIIGVFYPQKDKQRNLSL